MVFLGCAILSLASRSRWVLVSSAVWATGNRAPDLQRLQAWLADARISCDAGDRPRGRRSLAAALRLAEREQLTLPFALERGWIAPVLRREPELTAVYRRLLSPVVSDDLLPARDAPGRPRFW